MHPATLTGLSNVRYGSEADTDLRVESGLLSCNLRR
jgi:hypothetical protein